MGRDAANSRHHVRSAIERKEPRWLRTALQRMDQSNASFAPLPASLRTGTRRCPNCIGRRAEVFAGQSSGQGADQVLDAHPPADGRPERGRDRRVHGGQSGHRGRVRSHPEHEVRRRRCSPRWGPGPARTSSTWTTTQMRSIYIPRGLVQEVDPAALGFGSTGRAEGRIHPGRLRGRHRRRQDLRPAERVQRHRLRHQHRRLRGGRARSRQPAQDLGRGRRRWARSWSSRMATR